MRSSATPCHRCKSEGQIITPTRTRVSTATTNQFSLRQLLFSNERSPTTRQKADSSELRLRIRLSAQREDGRPKRPHQLDIQHPQDHAMVVLRLLPRPPCHQTRHCQPSEPGALCRTALLRIPGKKIRYRFLNLLWFFCLFAFLLFVFVLSPFFSLFLLYVASSGSPSLLAHGYLANPYAYRIKKKYPGKTVRWKD